MSRLSDDYVPPAAGGTGSGQFMAQIYVSFTTAGLVA